MTDARATAPFVATTETLTYYTAAAPHFRDITAEVADVVRRSGVRAGQVVVFSRHTTAAIRINEHEPLLLRDLARLVQTAAPAHAYYEHNDFERRTDHMTADEPRNGHAHCQQLLLGTSEAIPIVAGALALGPWQAIFLIELDEPRWREVLVSVVGVP